MMSFRFHLVSLTAVFLAFSLGIVIGSTVVDKATVDVLEGRIKTVRDNAAAADRARDELRADAEVWRQFSEQAGPALLAGRLAGVRVLVVSTEGVDEGAVNAVRADLTRAGATDAGSIILDRDWDQDDAKTRGALAAALGLGAELPRMAALREQTASVLAAEWAAGNSPLTARLADAGLLRVSGPSADGAVPGLDTRFVVVGGEPANALAVPLVRALGQAAPNRVVAAEVAPADREVPPTAALVGPLRKERGDGRLSTVDHVETFRGRVATILALAAGGRGEAGDYGTAPGADRAVPANGS